MPVVKSKGTKNGKQKYRVIINYTDLSGNYRKLERTAYGAAEAKLLEQQLNFENKREKTSASLTVSELLAEYKTVKSMENRESTVIKAVEIINNNVIPTLGNIKLSKLSIPMLQDWKVMIDKKLKTNGENIKLATKQKRYAAFNALLNYAVQAEHILVNPLSKIGNFKDTGNEVDVSADDNIDFYTAEEFEKFIKAARNNAEEKNLFEWQFYVFFNILFYMGLRKGEANALTWNDINHNVMRVNKSVTQKIKGGDRITRPKNKKSIRDIQIPLPLKKILDEHYSRCKQIDGFKKTMFICGGARALRDTTIQKRLESFANAAEVKIIRVHDFRHTHASLLANEGINIQEIARRLGHAKVEETWNTYSHLYPREQERAIAILNKIA